MQRQTQLQLSNQKHVNQSNYRRGDQGKGAPTFLYNGSGYASNNMSNQNVHVDSDGEQSDFKTTTLRFTNNNFIEERKRERESSYGQIRENIGQQNGNTLLNTLNSQQAQAIRERNAPFNKFGTSDNFQTGAYNVNGSNGKPSIGGFDQRTDGFKASR